MDIKDYLEQCQSLVNEALDQKLPPEDVEPIHLNQSIRYAVLNGGKRLRSAFIYAVGDLLGADKLTLTDISVAVELMHTASIIHDDLPALDNDDLRRGKPTCHVVFGEATAILTGDVLQSLSFETLAKIKTIESGQVLDMIQLFASAMGSYGLIGGEEMDLEAVGQLVDVNNLELIYKLKTGSLMKASVVMAAIAANCNNASVLSDISKFGEYIGVAFQIHDDIIGIESDTATLGKKQNADLERNKPVYPFVAGLEQAKKRRDEYFTMALQHLEKANCLNDNLIKLSEYVIARKH